MATFDFDLGQSPLLTKVTSRGLLAVDELRPHAVFFALSVVIATTIATLGRAVYRLYFDPLSKYPGPWFAAVSSMYNHYHILKGDLPQTLLELHKKYGPIIRLGPKHLVYLDDAAWKDIYGHRTGGRQANRRFVTVHAYPGHESVIQAETEENHSRQRRIFSHAFSEQSLRKQEPMFKKYVDMLISNLTTQQANAPAQPFNLVDHYNFTTFDVMGDLTFNEPLGLLENSEYSPWVKLTFQSIKANIFTVVIRQYYVLGWLVKKFMLSAAFKGRANHLRFSEERVDRRVAKGTEEPDIWNLVMNQKGDRMLTRKEMYANASLFMIAGTETTATLLSGLTYWLLKTPGALNKLRAELDETFPGGKEITSEKLAHAKYLNACLEEALRIYPPVPGSQTRITPAEGTKVLGEFIPGNTMVGVTQWAVNHSEENFALPEEFHPERWLDGEGSDARFANDNRSAKQSFSVGPRNCLGRNMAWFEMRLIAAEMFLAFDMELCRESDNWSRQKVFALWEKKPLMVKLTARAGMDPRD